MKRFIITLFFLSFMVNVFAQMRTELMYRRAALDVKFNKVGETVTYTLDEISGTPYLNEKFVTSKVLLNDGGVMDSVILNYNIFTDSFEFMKNDVSYILTNNYIVDKIHFDNKVFVYKKYLDLKDQPKYGYVEQLADGKSVLLKKYQVSFRDPVPAETQFNESKAARFVQKEPYYLIFFSDKEKMVRINTRNKKKFSELFGERKDEVYSYIKSKRLKLTEEEDLKNIIIYYNTF